ncbi:MAG: hypothetical protein QW728_03540, partial [Thermoplasmata archaeon]
CDEGGWHYTDASEAYGSNEIVLYPTGSISIAELLLETFREMGNQSALSACHRTARMLSFLNSPANSTGGFPASFAIGSITWSNPQDTNYRPASIEATASAAAFLLKMASYDTSGLYLSSALRALNWLCRARMVGNITGNFTINLTGWPSAADPATASPLSGDCNVISTSLALRALMAGYINTLNSTYLYHLYSGLSWLLSIQSKTGGFPLTAPGNWTAQQYPNSTAQTVNTSLTLNTYATAHAGLILYLAGTEFMNTEFLTSVLNATGFFEKAIFPDGRLFRTYCCSDNNYSSTQYILLPATDTLWWEEWDSGVILEFLEKVTSRWNSRVYADMLNSLALSLISSRRIGKIVVPASYTYNDAGEITSGTLQGLQIITSPTYQAVLVESALKADLYAVPEKKNSLLLPAMAAVDTLVSMFDSRGGWHAEYIYGVRREGLTFNDFLENSDITSSLLPTVSASVSSPHIMLGSPESVIAANALFDFIRLSDIGQEKIFFSDVKVRYDFTSLKLDSEVTMRVLDAVRANGSFLYYEFRGEEGGANAFFSSRKLDAISGPSESITVSFSTLYSGAFNAGFILKTPSGAIADYITTSFYIEPVETMDELALRYLSEYTSEEGGIVNIEGESSMLYSILSLSALSRFSTLAGGDTNINYYDTLRSEKVNSVVQASDRLARYIASNLNALLNNSSLSQELESLIDEFNISTGWGVLTPYKSYFSLYDSRWLSALAALSFTSLATSTGNYLWLSTANDITESLTENVNDRILITNTTILNTTNSTGNFSISTILRGGWEFNNETDIELSSLCLAAAGKTYGAMLRTGTLAGIKNTLFIGNNTENNSEMNNTEQQAGGGWQAISSSGSYCFSLPARIVLRLETLYKLAVNLTEQYLKKCELSAFTGLNNNTTEWNSVFSLLWGLKTIRECFSALRSYFINRYSSSAQEFMLDAIKV